MQQPATFQVFNASAGSGKTYTLVKEYLKILLRTSDPDRFKHILAVTFTNKAATEMKQRVISNLREFTQPDGSKNKSNLFQQLENELEIDAGQLHERAHKVLLRILFNYSAFNITTIDSFTHRLIRNFAFDLGLSLNFDVEMDTSAMLNEAVDLLLVKIGEDKQLTKILIDYSLQKANEDRSWDISRDLKEMAQLLLNEQDLVHVQNLQKKSLDDFVRLKNKLHNAVLAAEKHLRDIGGLSLEKLDDAQLAPENFIRKTFPNFLQDLKNFNKKFDYSKRSATIEKAIAEHRFYTKNTAEQIKNRIEELLPDLIVLFNQSKEVFEQKRRYELLLKNTIPLAVLSKINESLDALKASKNMRLNAEFNTLISGYLKEQPVAFIYERLGERYQHFFIDEMQDTSILQWQNLIPLISNALSQQDSSLFLVGDVKQSIYRWRGGEAEQFMGLASNTNPFVIDKEVRALGTNFRSYSTITDFNNQFFQFLSRYFQDERYRQIYLNENRQKSTEKNGGYVRLSFIEEGLLAADKDERYPQKVLEIIHELKDQYDLREICVLTRTRKQGVAVADYLISNNIDIVSSESLLLKNSLKIQFIIHLLSYLEQRSNSQAQLELLYFIYKNYRIETDKHQFLSSMIHTDSDTFFKRLESYHISFDHRICVALPLYECIEYIIRSFDLNQNSDSYLLFFLDEVLQYSRNNSAGVSGFLEYWHEKNDRMSVEVPQENNAVHIMTIHKSKGLEFPVVIFPYDLNIYFENLAKIWYPLIDEQGLEDFKHLLITNKNSLKVLGSTGETGLNMLEKHQSTLELDAINLLYVILTRAIEQLYIISEKRKPADIPKWYSQFFIAYLQQQGLYHQDVDLYEFGTRQRLSTKSFPRSSSVTIKNMLSSSWQDRKINIVARAHLIWNSELGAAIDYGNLIHEILARIKYETDVQDAITYYENNSGIAADILNSITQTILAVVEHPSLNLYFDHDLLVFNEREILTNAKEIVIPDRIVINSDKKATIIDYKTGNQDKKHQQQLKIYEQAVYDLGYQIHKKLLVYIGPNIVVEEVD